jgi:MFS family permease
VSPGKAPLHRNVWVTAVTSFLTDVSSEMVMNVLPLFLVNVLGVRTAAIGFIEGVAESLSSFLKVLSGYFSDRAGKRKGLAVLGYAVSAASKPLLYFAASWPFVLFVRALDRVGKGIRTAPRDALLAESVSPLSRGRAFGLHRAFDSAGAAIGLLGALVVVWAGQRGTVALEPETFRLLVLAAVVPGLASVAVLALGAQDVPRSPSADPAASPLSLRGFDGPYRRFLLAVVLFTLGNSSDAFLVLRAQERGLSVLGILGMLVAFKLVYTAVAAPAGRLSDTLGRKKLIASGWLFYALLYFGFAFAREAWHVIALFVLYGIYYGLVDGVARAFVADLVPDRAKLGVAYGVYHAAVGAAALPASIAAGILWQGLGDFTGFGPSAPFFFGAAMALSATVLLLPIPVLSSAEEP